MAQSDDQQEHLLVNLWCCPRTLSTATMYSFAQRPDTLCFDEPLYASYLNKNPSMYRPYRDELLAAAATDGNEVMRRMLSGADARAAGKRVTFCKHIARQTLNLDRALILGDVEAPVGTRTSTAGTANTTVRHVFLFRDPLEMLVAWDARQEVHHEGCTLDATCFPQVMSLFSEVRQRAEAAAAASAQAQAQAQAQAPARSHPRPCLPPILIDSSSLQRHPREVLSRLCAALGLPFIENQLAWPAGPKPCDGLWAGHWYASVHRSTGFVSDANSLKDPWGSDGRRSQYPYLSPGHASIYRECLPFYTTLRRHAIGVDPLNPGSSAADQFCFEDPQALPDPRNASIFAWVGDRLLPREQAKISAFDSAVQGGDAVWEGVRVYSGRIFKLDEHLGRLFDSARAMAFQGVPSGDYIRAAIFKTLAMNGMRDEAHIRLTLTRGPKLTSSMNPTFNVFGCTLIVLAEWKPICGATTYDNALGVSLITAAGRRNSPQCVDSKIHHCNLINNILPKIQANLAHAADALMLDLEGFLSETNATNVFCVKGGLLATPEATSCLPGITRETVMRIAAALGISCQERRISLAEAHCCDEFFTTGTMGELTPVVSIDGRCIGDGRPGPVTARIQEAYRRITETEGTPLPF